MPPYADIIHTFREDIEEYCLDDSKEIIVNVFDKMYLNGKISANALNKR